MSREINAKTVQDTENASFRIQGTAGHIRHRGSAPGIITVNMAIYVGNTQAELAGAACVTLGVVLPALLLILFPAVCRVVAYGA